MRLTPEAHAHIEGFLRARLADERLTLPPVTVHCGRVAGGITRVFRIGAITFGRHLFVAPYWLGRDDAGGVRLPAWLAAHELVHVVQYRRAGAARFLFAYLGDYARALWREKRRGVAAHQIAYRAITQEEEAYATEKAYRAWAGGVESLPLI